jgi:hypothetical protein
VRLGIIGLDADCGAVALDRLFQLPLRAKHDAEVVMRDCVVRIDRDRATIVLDRALRLIERTVRFPSVRVIPRHVRRELDRARDQLDRRLRLTRASRDRAEQVERVGVVRVGLKDRATLHLALAQLPRLKQLRRSADARVRV